MKLAIMQPYFLPYIGYWQLISAVDVFVVYDNIQYTKTGWINRNRFLQNGTAKLFTIPIKKDSDYLDVRERSLAESFDRRKLLRQFSAAYAKAPYYEQVAPLLTEIINWEDENLFGYILHSVLAVCSYLSIKTKIIVSSSVPIDHSLKSEHKVLAICRALGADTYINAIGGQDLYSKERFSSNGIELRFIKSGDCQYRQFFDEFVPWLSILDVCMFNNRDDIRVMLANNIFV
jgi:hypothetical protein